MGNRFDELKVGDTVYVEEGVICGWGNFEYFWIPKTITKVTPTQIVLETGDRYRKSGGRLIGGRRDKWSVNRSGEEIKMLGDKENSWSDNAATVEDQTHAMEVCKNRLKDAATVRRLAENIGKITYDHRNLVEIAALVHRANMLLNEEN